MAEDKDNTPKGDVNFEFNQGITGLNMDSIPSQIDKGSLSYALNAALENFDNNSVTYQNEPGTEFCLNFPHNYIVIGRYLINEQAKQIFFLANPATGDSEIGYTINNDCVYHTLINAKCLNFDVHHPIHKVVHKVGNCGTEIYWAQTNADSRRYLNLDKIPFIPATGSTPCDSSPTTALDCNQIRVQPIYSIPQLEVTDVMSGGNLIAGTYQFAFQYSDALGNPLSNYYSVTNPTPIADPQQVTVNFNYPVGKSIVLEISNIETGGQFTFFNIAVIKTINGISSVELVGTYGIEGPTREITYSGQNMTQIRLTMGDVFEKFPFYGPADDVTTAQDVLIWKGLSAPERISYQKMASQITLQWETWRIPATKNYSDEILATNFRGYMRDEIYPFEIVYQLTSGRETDAFHIPGRVISAAEATMPFVLPSNDDFIEDAVRYPQGVPYWKIYNTAQVIGFSAGYPGPSVVGYEGAYQYGLFSYWESDQTYPCDKEMWGDLAEQPIRHHKFPDVEVSPIVECKSHTPGSTLEMGNIAIFPIGVKVDKNQIALLIENSDLTPEQKADIVGFKIVRGDRTDNKSVVAKGILRNVNKYTRDDEDFYYANYPYNDLNEDPFISATNNAWAQECEPFEVEVLKFNKPDGSANPTYVEIQYTDCNTNKTTTIPYYTLGMQPVLCSTSKPVMLGAGSSNDLVQTTSGPVPKKISTFSSIPLSVVLIRYANYDGWHLGSENGDFPGCSGCKPCQDWRAKWDDAYLGPGTTQNINGSGKSGRNIYVLMRPGADRDKICTDDCGVCGKIRDLLEVRRVDACKSSEPVKPIKDQDELAYRQIFNSPETSFGQPFLGDILKLESVIFGAGQAHFVQVKDNAKYRLLTEEAQRDALASSDAIAGDDPAAFFTAYQAYLEIYINGITRKNYAWSFNSIADYNYCVAVPDGQEVKQRRIDLKKYLIPSVQAVGEDDVDINNYQRETSVYLRTEGSDSPTSDPKPLPFPHKSPNMVATGVTDVSRFVAGCAGSLACATPTTTSTTTALVPAYCPAGGGCAEPAKKQPISVVSYYASIKNTFRGMWGQIYTYQTIDTGFHVSLTSTEPQPSTVFGGDTFICRFAFKTKLPFFIDNRVGAPDDSEIFYDELGNIAYPKYWHSARSILKDYTTKNGTVMTNIISFKAHNFDCPNCQYPGGPGINNPNRTFYDGMFYLFAYGIPNFYVETSYNVDLRQAFNNKEGEFWPHVSSSIPDDWVQESFVTIQQDNTYYYNVTFSKQNKETLYTHIPPNFQFKDCEFIFPFRAIFSDPQIATAGTTVNNWLTYRATSYFDFPQNYGKLTSLDGIDNRQVLARFENKSLMYNALYTNQVNPGGQVYLGQSLFARTAPPWDYGETDLGYVGSQHKFLLKIPQGQVSCDAKRGQVFLLGGQQAKDLSAPGTGMNRFFTDHLAFEILRFFPDKETTDPVTGEKIIFKGVNIDNNFNAIGLHGVYDSKYDRVIITKLDYIPLSTDIKYDSVLQEFYKEDGPLRTTVMLSDRDHFCNKSWTLSYSFVTQSWISFHSYLPNWYIGDNNFFYSGKKGCCTDVDFVLLSGELVPDPSTSTTSTTFPPPRTTSSTTTVPKDCVLVGGSVTLLDCDLEGTGIITIPPPIPPCTRPTNSQPFFMYSGYTTVTPPAAPVQVVTSATQLAACDGKKYVAANPDTSAVIEIIFWGTNLNVGTQLYAGNGTNDCTPAAPGFYYTTVPTEGIYEIDATGKIAAIHPCSTATTSSTTTCALYLYDVEFFSCATCTSMGPGTLGNASFLPQDKYYYDPITGFKFITNCYKGCGTGVDRTISAASAKDNCPAVVCPAAPPVCPTGFYSYETIDYSCINCAGVLIATVTRVNTVPLVTGKYYYDATTATKVYIASYNGCSAGPATSNISLSSQADTCLTVNCP